MLNRIKEKLGEPLDRSARFLHRVGFTPATTTLLGLMCAVVSGAAYYVTKHIPGMIYLALVFLVLSGFFDTVDGAIARLYSGVTHFGGILDSVCDRIEEIVVLIGIVAGGLVSGPIGLFALAGSLMVSYVRARAESEGGNMSGVGLAERPERLIVLAGATAVQFVDIGVLVIAAIAWITVVQRMLHAYRLFSEAKN